MNEDQKKRLDKIILWLDKRVVPSWEDARFMADLCVWQGGYIDKLCAPMRVIHTVEEHLALIESKYDATTEKEK